MNGDPLAPCYSSWFFYSKLLQRNRHFRIFRKGRTTVECVVYIFPIVFNVFVQDIVSGHTGFYHQLSQHNVISVLSKKFLSHSFSLSVNSFFGLPAFDWIGLMRSLNLFANAEMTSLRFLGLFGSVFATFWILLDPMWACEKAVIVLFCHEICGSSSSYTFFDSLPIFLFFLSLNS